MTEQFDVNSLKIYTFGRLKVYHGNTLISDEFGRSKKIWDLFIFLITHRHKQVSPEVIAEALWPDQNYANPSGSLKNLVHRLRKRIDLDSSNNASSLIISNYGCYGWNLNYPYWLDVEVFDRDILEAKKNILQDPELACRHFQKALKLYHGDYLAESTYTDWLLPIRHYYRQLFIESAAQLLDLLKDQKLYGQMLQECKKALFIEHYEEDFHLRYMEALLGEGKTNQAREHYEYVSKLFYNEFGTKPSADLRSLYRAIKQQSDKAELKQTDIRDVLQERDDSSGALYCDPDFFKFLCKLEKRRAAREDRPIHLGLLTFNNLDYQIPTSEQLKDPMYKLNKILSIRLRKGDVYTPWSDGQFAMLLPGTTHEQAETVLDRALKSFEQNYPSEKLVLNSSVHSVIPFEYL